MYSTCTLNPAENGEIVKRFLNEHPEFSPVNLDIQNVTEREMFEPSNEFTMFPHKNGTDGFFVALMKKN